MATLDTRALLGLHQAAYALLLEVDRRSAIDPRWLDAESVAAIRNPRQCLQWLRAHQGDFPQFRRIETRLHDAFAGLFSSFMSVSFEVDEVALGGQVLAARVGRRRQT